MCVLRLIIFVILKITCDGQFAPCISFDQESTYVGGGMCFKLYTDKINNFEDAKIQCAQSGGNLAEVRTHRQRMWILEEQDKFRSFLGFSYTKKAWLGASDLDGDSTMHWSSNNEVVNVPASWWEGGQPNVKKECLVVHNGQLDDNSCGELLYNVPCQKYVENPCDSFLPRSDFYNNTCYLPIGQAMSLSQAQDKCAADGAIVAEPQSVDAKLFFEAFVSDNFDLSQQIRVIIGASGIVGGDWLWDKSDEPITTSHWLNVTNLGPATSGGDTVVIVRKGVSDVNGRLSWGWSVANAWEPGYFVCAKDISQECEGTFAQGSCFTLYTQKKTWTQAKRLCEVTGSYLAEPKTEALSVALDAYLTPSSLSVWLGGSDSEFERDFMWTQYGEKFSFANWQSGAPTSASKDHDFILWQYGSWVDMPSSHKTYFVCQMEIAVTSVVYAAYLPAGPDHLQTVQLSVSMQLSSTSQSLFSHMKVSSNALQAVQRHNVYRQRGLTLAPFGGHNIDTQDLNVWVIVNASVPVDFVVLIPQTDSLRSTLIYPMNWVSTNSFFLNSHPQNYDICVISPSGYSTNVNLALYGYNRIVKARLDEASINSRSYARLSTTQHETDDMLLVSQVSGNTKAPFVSANRSISVFIKGRETTYQSSYGIFDQMLPTSLVGSEYITFPSLPLNPDAIDAFSMVAVHNNTVIAIWDPSVGTSSAFLMTSGDVHDINVPASKFLKISGNKPFYLYSRLYAPGHTLSACSLTLLPNHLWSSSYSFQMEGHWLRMDVYVIFIAKSTTLQNLEGVDWLKAVCQTVSGTEYKGCYYLLPRELGLYAFHLVGSAGVMAAYVFASTSRSRACHQMGVPVNSFSGTAILPVFYPEVYLSYLDSSTMCPETAVETTSCPSVNEPSTQSMVSETTESDGSTTGPAQVASMVNDPSLIWTQSGQTNNGTGYLGSTQTPPQVTTYDIQTANANEGTTTVTGNTEATGSGNTEATGSGCLVFSPNVNLTAEELQSLVEQISAELRVDKRFTSTFRRGKESAPDPRSSSVAYGLFSIALISAALALIVLSDVYSVFGACQPKILAYLGSEST